MNCIRNTVLRHIAPPGLIRAALLLLLFHATYGPAAEPTVSTASGGFEVVHGGSSEPVVSDAAGEDILRWLSPLVARRPLGRPPEAWLAAWSLRPVHRRQAQPASHSDLRVLFLAARGSLPLLL